MEDKTVEERLQALEAQLAILRIEGAYARTWDSADARAWATLFTEDGVFEIAPIKDAPASKYEGHSELVEFCAVTNRQFQGIHLLHLPEISIEGDCARASVHFKFDYSKQSSGALEVISVTGIYSVRYELTNEGWKIVNRVERATGRNYSAAYPGFYGT